MFCTLLSTLLFIGASETMFPPRYIHYPVSIDGFLPNFFSPVHPETKVN